MKLSLRHYFVIVSAIGLCINAYYLLKVFISNSEYPEWLAFFNCAYSLLVLYDSFRTKKKK